MGLILMCELRAKNPEEYNKIITPLAWKSFSEAEAIRRMNDLILAKGYMEAQAYKEVRKIDRSLKFLTAVDEVCGSCYYCTEEQCESCPVQ